MKPATFTPTDKEVLNFIRTYKARNNGNSPSHREIVDGTVISSTGHLTFILKKLERFGLIKVNPGHRSIIIPE